MLLVVKHSHRRQPSKLDADSLSTTVTGACPTTAEERGPENIMTAGFVVLTSRAPVCICKLYDQRCSCDALQSVSHAQGRKDVLHEPLVGGSSQSSIPQPLEDVRYCRPLIPNRLFSRDGEGTMIAEFSTHIVLAINLALTSCSVQSPPRHRTHLALSLSEATWR